MAKSKVGAKQIVSWLKIAFDATEKQLEYESDDLKFQLPDKQWSDEARQMRGAFTWNGVQVPGRPMLSVATLDEPLQLVSNQFQKAHLGIQIHPLNAEASDETAEVLQGLYRRIEQDSRAQLGRGWAFDRAFKAGRGFYRILTEYDPNGADPDDQRIVIKRILYQASVFFDPFAQEPDWSDARWVIIIEDMPWDKYKSLYGESKLGAYSDGELAAFAKKAPDGWLGGEPDARTVRVAECYYLEQYDPTDAQEQPHVCYVKVNAIETLESEPKYPGRYLPVLVAIGKELQPFDEKRHWIGMIRPARDGVKLTNYAASGAVEMAALEPKVPWKAVEGVIDPYLNDYARSNLQNIPVLRWRQRDLEGNQAPEPTRVQVDVSRLGPSMQLLSMGRDFVQSATSTFDPALGKQPTAHRSGRAIVALQDQTVEGTSNYVMTFAELTMPREALIVLDLIPHVYDRAGRVERILDGNGKSSWVMLNKTFQTDPQTGRPAPMQATPAQIADKSHPAKLYDLSKGRYGVEISVGKSFKDRRDEGQTKLEAFLSSDPEMMLALGPEYFAYVGEPWARDAGQVIKQIRDAKYPFLAQDGNQNLAAENQQLKAQLQQLGQVASKMHQDLTTDAAKNAADYAREQLKSNTTLQKTVMDNDARMYAAELSAKVDKLSELMEGVRLQMELASGERQAGLDRAHDVGMAAQGQQFDANQAQQQQAHDVGMAAQGAALAPPPAPQNGNGNGDTAE